MIPPRNVKIASVVRLTVARNRTVSIPSRRISTKVRPKSPAATAPLRCAAITSTCASIRCFSLRAALIIQTTIVTTKTAPRIISQPS